MHALRIVQYARRFGWGYRDIREVPAWLDNWIFPVDDLLYERSRK